MKMQAFSLLKDMNDAEQVTGCWIARSTEHTHQNERHALHFDRLRQRQLFERGWLDRFMAVMPAHPLVLDLGCGSAEPMAAYLMEKGCFLSAVDTSDKLLHLCQQRFPQN